MTFTPDTHETPVIFRAFPDGEVIAIFPAEPATYHGYDVTSYMHVGQHGSCSTGVVNCTQLATPEEYANLRRELESAPYGYRLKICVRWSAQHRAAAKAEQVRLHRRAKAQA